MVPSAIDAAMAISLVVVSATPRATNRVSAARSTRALVSSALPMAASTVRRRHAPTGELAQPVAALARPQPDAEQAEQQAGRHVDEVVLIGGHDRYHDDQRPQRKGEQRPAR